MKNKVTLLFSLIVIISAGISGTPKKNKTSLFIVYKSQAISLEVKDTSLTITKKMDIFDSPMSSIPSDTKLEETKYTLTKEELSKLIQFIKSSGFFALDSDSGAPEEERNYPTSIFVQLNSRSNEVVHRSNPAYANAEEAFTKVEQYLLNLKK